MTEFEYTQFDWDTYEQTKPPVYTRRGDEVSQLTCFNTSDDEICLVGVVRGSLFGWNDDGSTYRGTPSDFDLVFRKERKVYTRYVNIYPEGPSAQLFISPDLANQCAARGRIACKEIQIEVDVVR